MRADSKNYEDWLAKAENDLKAAKGILYYYEEPPTDTVCYHCHQTAEKSLKGFLVYSVGEIPKTHDLVELLNLCISINDKLSDYKEEVEILNKYYIEAKYPPDQPILYPIEETKEAVTKAKKVFEFIESLVLSKR